MKAQPGELEFCNLFERASQIGYAFAKAIGRDPAGFILAAQLKVVELVQEKKPQAAYDYLTAIAIGTAHRKGLGNPQF